MLVKVPNYKEVYVDEGEINMIQMLRILKRNSFKVVFLSDLLLNEMRGALVRRNGLRNGLYESSNVNN